MKNNQWLKYLLPVLIGIPMYGLYLLTKNVFHLSTALAHAIVLALGAGVFVNIYERTFHGKHKAKPEPTLEDIKGKSYDRNNDDYEAFPVIYKDGIPTPIVLPCEVASVLRKEFNLTDYRKPLEKDIVENWLAAHQINIGKSGIDWSSFANKSPKVPKDILNSLERLTPIPDNTEFNPHPWSMPTDSKSDYVMRFMQDGKFVEIAAGSNEMFNAYLHKFKNVPAEFPNKEEFNQWYNEYTSGFADLKPAPSYLAPTNDVIEKQIETEKVINEIKTWKPIAGSDVGKLNIPNQTVTFDEPVQFNDTVNIKSKDPINIKAPRGYKQAASRKTNHKPSKSVTQAAKKSNKAAPVSKAPVKKKK